MCRSIRCSNALRWRIFLRIAARNCCSGPKHVWRHWKTGDRPKRLPSAWTNWMLWERCRGVTKSARTIRRTIRMICAPFYIPADQLVAQGRHAQSCQSVARRGQCGRIISGMERDDVTLAVLPLSFDYGQNQLLSTWFAGGCGSPAGLSFPKDVAKACAKHGVTTLAAVPPLWVQLTELDWPQEATAPHAPPDQ